MPAPAGERTRPSLSALWLGQLDNELKPQSGDDTFEF